jgi:uncharacterized protein YcbX
MPNPRVARLSIAPVRSLQLNHPDSIELTASGVVEDRRFYLIDDAGDLVDRVVVGTLVQVRSWTDPDATRLRLSFPDGSEIDGEVALGEAVVTHLHGRVAVGRIVEGPWADALEPYAGRRVRIVRCDRVGGTRLPDKNAVSLVGDGSMRALARELGAEAIDLRRFRMLIDLEGAAEHEEDGWIGGEIEIGTARLRITKPDARCAITTQDPDTGHRDLDTLRALRRYRGIRMSDEGPRLDFGVIGDVVVPGRVSLGDEVRVVVPGGETFERVGASG